MGLGLRGDRDPGGRYFSDRFLISNMRPYICHFPQEPNFNYVVAYAVLGRVGESLFYFHQNVEQYHISMIYSLGNMSTSN